MSQLARRYLALPGSSAAGERVFSGAADVCGTDRGSLKPRTIERAVACQQWMRQGVKMPPGWDRTRILSESGAA
jgi:hypothetical protein